MATLKARLLQKDVEEAQLKVQHAQKDVSATKESVHCCVLAVPQDQESSDGGGLIAALVIPVTFLGFVWFCSVF